MIKREFRPLFKFFEIFFCWFRFSSSNLLAGLGGWKRQEK